VIDIRALTLDELSMCTAIDVTEEGDVVFEQHGSDILPHHEGWSRPPRGASEWAGFEARWRAFVPASGLALGAFHDGCIVGVATLRRGIRPGLDQLEALFVDRAHRRMGVASRLVERVAEASRTAGARGLYVSATPSASAVGFYLALGFMPVAEPLPELFALEPEDIHMLLALERVRAEGQG
jgi:GNAT superfamily N-acetyltransferase